MNISYNWLKQYIELDQSPEQISELLTNCGLEVESIETYESIKGGLDGLVIGEVLTKTKHPNADKLSLTTVNIGMETPLHIVCGAPNVEAGQKVVIATIGSKLYPTEGEAFEIKKSKIRGELSEGMICAEDEIGLGCSHAGIMVLNPAANVGTKASEYFKVEKDFVFVIGLTPNRSDAASHFGVARDLAAVLRKHNKKCLRPSVDGIKLNEQNKKIEVVVENTNACPRYSGISMTGIKVKESPAWLQNRLKAIGLRPINNIVDITNFVLHEQGQPLHAFDADKIKGDKIIVKNLADGTPFLTLDQTERKLSGNDLMICDAEKGMCIAGVFGGIYSGVNENTKNIFLESAYFNPVSIRKTARHHGLHTDASFRFERGTDPDLTVYALKRAALLIQEIAGGQIDSDIFDIYPKPVLPVIIHLSYHYLDRLIGASIDRNEIIQILLALEMNIIEEKEDGLILSVPPFKTDVQRECDIAEEILRIYGCNQIALPQKMHSSLNYSIKPDGDKIKNVISDYLSNNGFSEIICNSLTKSGYASLLSSTSEEKSVRILNPLSSDLDVLRQSLLFGGLETLVYNQNRQQHDLKLYEFGKIYQQKSNGQHVEEEFLAIFVMGRKQNENWHTTKDKADFYSLKEAIENILKKLGIKANELNIQQLEASPVFNMGLSYHSKINKTNLSLINIGLINSSIIKKFDVNQEVWFAEINWGQLIPLHSKQKLAYKEVAKFPFIRRDLALLLDKQIQFANLKEIAFSVSDKSILREVNLFDVFEGKNLAEGKKSYALSFIFQDENKTLTDTQIDKAMGALVKAFEEKAGALIR
jgi:phenylalanyl-tRNA synthetase beta chain